MRRSIVIGDVHGCIVELARYSSDLPSRRTIP